MKRNALIVSSLAALMALSLSAQAHNGYAYRRVEARYGRREPVVAYRHWGRPERVVVRKVVPAPVCVAPAPVRYVVEEPVRVVAPLSIGLRLHGLRLGLNL